MIEEYDLRSEGDGSEKEFEQVLRPQLFEDFSGQNKIIENLKATHSAPNHCTK